MSDTTLGIFIIIFFVIMGFVSDGKIFRAPNTSDEAPYVYPDYEYNDPNDPDDELTYVESQRQLRLISAQATDINEELQRIIDEENASPYQDKVYISSISNPGHLDSYIELQSDLDQGESVLISGWKLRSKATGEEMTIGAVSRIPNYGLPRDSAIVLGPNSSVIVSDRQPPSYGSFQLNICTGFLDPRDLLEPSLPQQCPLLVENLPPPTSERDNECLDYLESISSCEVPDEDDYPRGLSSFCKNYIEENINYQSCVTRHRFDPDFFVPEWRVFTSYRGDLGLEKRDVIQLLDHAGKVVDSYIVN